MVCSLVKVLKSKSKSKFNSKVKEEKKICDFVGISWCIIIIGDIFVFLLLLWEVYDLFFIIKFICVVVGFIVVLRFCLYFLI